jgi:hypothetical protein
MIGQKKEEPSIIDDLLDIEKYPGKPEYMMSSEGPLILYDCEFKDLSWTIKQKELSDLIKHFQDEWLIHQTRAQAVKSMINLLTDSYSQQFKNTPEDFFKDGKPTRNLEQPYASLNSKSNMQSHVKLKDRKTMNSLENRVDHFIKKRRLDAQVYEKINESTQLAQTYKIYKPKDGQTDKEDEIK